jgi:hypothetical protein
MLKNHLGFVYLPVISISSVWKKAESCYPNVVDSFHVKDDKKYIVGHWFNRQLNCERADQDIRQLKKKIPLKIFRQSCLFY